MILKFCLLLAACLSLLSGFSQSSFLTHDQFKIMQLTHDNSGHTIHNSQCFSPDDEWIVFDTRSIKRFMGQVWELQLSHPRTTV